MKFDELLSRLEKVKRSGLSARARCPVHGSKGQTLSISDKDGGYIVANCFSCGADGLALVKALGLPTSILFPEGSEYVRPTVTREMKDRALIDAFILNQAPKAETLEDHRAITKAKERAKGFEMKLEASDQEVPPKDHPALDDFRQHFGEVIGQSSALRSEIVESHWQGVADRVRRSEAEMIESQPEQIAEPTPKSSAESWLLNL